MKQSIAASGEEVDDVARWHGRKQPLPSGELLDCGCDTGTTSPPLADALGATCTVTGVDEPAPWLARAPVAARYVVAARRG